MDIPDYHSRKTHNIINENHFKGLNKLIKFHLHCHCTNLDKNILLDLPNLENIKIITDISSFDNDFFWRQSNLNYLHIRNRCILNNDLTLFN